jgi:hypothetical protein
LVTGEIAGKEAHVEGFLFFAFLVFGGEGGFVDKIDFTAEEWFNAVFFCLFKETGKAIEDAVVGNGKGFHAHFCGAGTEAVDPRTSIQKAVVGMDVKVDKFAVFFWHLSLIWSLVGGRQGQAAGRAKINVF